MTVYVDESIFPFRGQLYCHVWADTVEELHQAAQAAGLLRSWFQQPPKASWEHYDCAPRIRTILVRNGAIECDRYEALRWRFKKILNDPNSTPRQREIALHWQARWDEFHNTDLFGPYPA